MEGRRVGFSNSCHLPPKKKPHAPSRGLGLVALRLSQPRSGCIPSAGHDGPLLYPGPLCGGESGSTGRAAGIGMDADAFSPAQGCAVEKPDPGSRTCRPGMGGKRHAGWPSLLVTFLLATQEKSDSVAECDRPLCFKLLIQDMQEGMTHPLFCRTASRALLRQLCLEALARSFHVSTASCGIHQCIRIAFFAPGHACPQIHGARMRIERDVARQRRDHREAVLEILDDIRVLRVADQSVTGCRQAAHIDHVQAALALA